MQQRPHFFGQCAAAVVGPPWPLLFHTLCVSFGWPVLLICAQNFYNIAVAAAPAEEQNPKHQHWQRQQRQQEEQEQWQEANGNSNLWYESSISNINETQQRQRRHRRRAPLLSRGYCRQLRLCFVYERSKTESVVCLRRISRPRQGRESPGETSVAFGIVRFGKKRK